MHAKPLIVLVIVLIANCGFWLHLFNRINATGLPRKLTKSFEKLIVAACFVLPSSMLFAYRAALLAWLQQANLWLPENGGWFNIYAVCCLISGVLLGLGWLESRRWLIPPSHLLAVHTQQHDVHRSIAGGTPADRTTRFLQCLPGNEIGQLQVTRKELLLPRRLPGVDGLRLGHISDLHFTGQYRPEHYHFVLDRFLELEPDLIIVSGDIIDHDHCLSWIEPLLGRLQAPYGVSFVLGNHDCRVRAFDELLKSLAALGHFDLGQQDQWIQLQNGTQVELLGNELPWLQRRESPSLNLGLAATSPTNGSTNLRIAVCHSPDQIDWARKMSCDLMLAGHTHGGQVRFPGIGPIVAPSRFGTRFASGVFYLPPTLMHVSRGLAGTHPLRWRCVPEASLLTLRSPP